jgi:hypothetical protein
MIHKTLRLLVFTVLDFERIEEEEEFSKEIINGSFNTAIRP